MGIVEVCQFSAGHFDLPQHLQFVGLNVLQGNEFVRARALATICFACSSNMWMKVTFLRDMP